MKFVRLFHRQPLGKWRCVKLTLIDSLTHELFPYRLHGHRGISHLCLVLSTYPRIIKQRTRQPMVTGISIGGYEDARYNRLGIVVFPAAAGRFVKLSDGSSWRLLPRDIMSRFNKAIPESFSKLIIFRHQTSDPGFGRSFSVRSCVQYA